MHGTAFLPKWGVLNPLRGPNHSIRLDLHVELLRCPLDPVLDRGDLVAVVLGGVVLVTR